MEAGEQIDTSSRRRSRRLLGAFFIAAGVNHFAQPGSYRAIVPPSLDTERALRWSRSAASPRSLGGARRAAAGATRRLGGRRADRAARRGVPGEPLHGAQHPSVSRRIPRWALYARLPLQPLMMLWAWRATR